MKKINIKTLCNVSDCLHITPTYAKEGYPMIRVSEINNKFLKLSNSEKVSEEDYKKYVSNYVPQKGDIILARVGAFLGEFAYVDTDEKICIGQNTTILNPKKYGKYIYYNLISDITQKRIQKEAAGSAYKSVGVDTIKNFEINMPDDIEDAETIGNFLYNIDKRISNNSEICYNLEKMARDIYRRWFLQFEFDDNESIQTEWNEELKKEIPIGWEVKSLKDILVKNSEPFDYKNSGVETIDLSVMPSGSICIEEINTSDNFSTNLFKMKKGSILFGTIRPYLKKAAIAICDGAYAGTVLSYNPIHEYDYNLALMVMSDDNFFSYAVKNSKGTKMPVVGNDELMNYKFAYNKEYAQKFNDVINLKDMICNKLQQNLELKKLRDFYIPLFMSGQIQIKK